MKKNLLPVILILVGAALVAYPYLFTGNVNDLDLKIETTPVIMPACYKVYANSEAMSGRFYLFKMMMTNKGKSPVNNVKVNYEIPRYIEKTELAKIPVIYPGQSVVLACYPVFNDDIVNKTTSSKEKTKIFIETASGETDKEFAFEMKGRNEFVYSCIPNDEIRSYSDMYDNDPLTACYVTPEDPIIKYYTQQIQEKILKGESASVNKKTEEAIRFLLGVYQATYLSHMVYSGTSGVPEKIDDLSTLVQNIRLPREVVTGNTGLCIELSVLYASVMMSAGLDPVIYLIPGHAYPGFKLNGQYFAIEATGIGGEGMGGRIDAEAAFKKGMKQLDEFMQYLQMGDERFSMLDIRELVQAQIKPMELKDDAFLRQKIDKIAESWSAGRALPGNINYAQQQVPNQGGNTGGGNDFDNSGASGMRRYNGPVSFNYPAGWTHYNRPYPQELPQLVSQFVSPDQLATLQVFQIQGTGNPNQAMQMIQQQLYMGGQQLQFQPSGNNGAFQIFNGTTYSQYGSLQWVAYMKPSGGGVAGLVLGYSQGGNVYNNLFAQVIASLR